MHTSLVLDLLEVFLASIVEAEGKGTAGQKPSTVSFRLLGASRIRKMTLAKAEGAVANS